MKKYELTTSDILLQFKSAFFVINKLKMLETKGFKEGLKISKLNMPLP